MIPTRNWMHYGLAAALWGLTFSGCAGTGSNNMVQQPKMQMPRLKKPVDSPLSNAQVSNVQLAMARTLERQGELEKARQAYEHIVGQNPREADALHRLAIVCDRLGHPEEAEKHFKRALKLKPGNADLFCDLGYSYYLQKRWAEADMNLKQAVALDPHMQRAHNNLGLLYAQTDRLDYAFEEFRLAGCTQAESHANLAFVMTTRDEWGAARDQYEHALALDPSLELAEKRLQFLDRSLAQAQIKPPASGSSKQSQIEPIALSNATKVELTSYTEQLPTPAAAREPDSISEPETVSHIEPEPVPYSEQKPEALQPPKSPTSIMTAEGTQGIDEDEKIR